MKNILSCIVMMLCMSVYGQNNDSLQVDTMKTQNLSNVTITSRRAGTRKISGAVNGVIINKAELFKAACCNLGESFTTNPSVDVNYSDAATGAKQIKLLGLSGTYVQMLTENLPNFRGAAAPFALDYVPGPRYQQFVLHPPFWQDPEAECRVLSHPFQPSGRHRLRQQPH